MDPSASTASAARPVHPRIMTWLCYLSLFAVSIPCSSLPVILTTLQEDFDLNGEQSGRINSINFSGVILTVLASAVVGSRLTPKLAMVSGSFLIGVGCVVQSVAPTIHIVNLGAFLQGAGVGLLDLMASPVVTALNPDDRAAALNIAHGFFCVGAVFVSLSSTLLVSLGTGWRWVTVAVAPVPVGLGFAFLTQTFPEIVEDGVGNEESWGVLLRSPSFLWANAGMFFGGAFELGPSTWLPALVESLGFDKWVGGFSLIIFAVTMGAGRFLEGRPNNRLDPVTVVALFSSVGLVAALVASYFPQRHIALLGGAMIGFGVSALWPTLLAVSQDTHPNGGAKMFALLTITGNAGAVYMPWAMGGLMDVSSVRCGFSLSASNGVFLLLLVYVWRKCMAGKLGGGAKEQQPQKLEEEDTEMSV
eukprot:PhM_4_TR12905/c0_g1_i1/m.105963